MNAKALRRETRRYRGTGAISEENGSFGFRPAFLDAQTNRAYLARFADGRPAPCHMLDGLPDEIVLSRNAAGGVGSLRPTVISGFRFEGRFYSREDAARKLSELS